MDRIAGFGIGGIGLLSSVAVAGCCWLPSPVAWGQGGDPAGSANRVGEGGLPEGDGIAAGYLQDRGIGAHPGVWFADGFESGAVGENWDEVRNGESEKGVLELVPPPGVDGGEGRGVGPSVLGERCLRVTAHLGSDTGGGLTRWFEPGRDVHVRFYVRFAEDCDYVHHFVTLRANRGLQGGDRWSGFGGAGVRPEGGERFSTALEPWGNWGRNPPPGRWNFYSYWFEMEASPDGKYWGNAFRPAEQPVIERGRWICCEFLLRHNSPGERDGEQAFWIDGQLRGHWTGIAWRKEEKLMANALTLESYVTDRWTENEENTVYFDNVVVADRYIGPTAPGQ